MSYALARPLLFALDPETAHHVALKLSGVAAALASAPPPCPVQAMGLRFPNPVGLSAGLDKHAEQVGPLTRMGFGFVELGGVTPRPQPGNPRPRLFRLPEAQAIINRFGLNSVGVDAFVRNLAAAERRPGVVVGVNVGKNKDTPNDSAAEDYEACLEKLYPHVDYVSLNVSSPNTPGLRDLQDTAYLQALLARVMRRRDALRERHGRTVAILVKLSPDSSDEDLAQMADVSRRERLDGIIATNTTVARADVEGHPHAHETGGLSGAPLRKRSTRAIRALAAAVKGELPIIGVGGILSGADAAEKIAAGATLVQLYTGLIYRGPDLIAECVSACLATSGTPQRAAP